MLRTITFAVSLFGALILSMTASMAATPPLPPIADFPIQLVLDDDGAEASFGMTGAAARQFMWFNSFSNPGPFTLEEIWVLFPNNADVVLNGNIQLAVFIDPDGNPTTGADLLATYDVTIQAKDGNTFSVYPLPTGLDITGAGKILIGVINRYFTTGVDPPPTLPAAFDSTSSQGGSYFAMWAGDPPSPSELGTATIIDGAVAGNFMIRGFGTLQEVEAIPALGPFGLALLTVFLTFAGFLVLRRHRHRTVRC